MTALNEIEEALNDLTWLANTSAHPHQEEITERYENIRQALTQLAALRDGYVMVPREPNAFILMEMQEAFDPRSLTMMHAFEKSYKAMIAAATTEKPNDKT